LTSAGRVFVLFVLVKIVIIIFFLVEKEILVLIGKATLGGRTVMGWVETTVPKTRLTSRAL